MSRTWEDDEEAEPRYLVDTLLSNLTYHQSMLFGNDDKYVSVDGQVCWIDVCMYYQCRGLSRTHINIFYNHKREWLNNKLFYHFKALIYHNIILPLSKILLNYILKKYK